MKKVLLLSFCFLALATANSQEPDNIPTLLEITPLVEDVTKNGIASKRSDKMKQKIKNIKKNRFTREMRNVRFMDVSKITTEESKGYFKMDIPKSQKGGKIKNVLVVPKEIEAKENGDYYYFGDLVHGQNDRGSIVLIKENGEHYGSIQIGERDFQIMNIGKNDQVLIEKTPPTATSCATSDVGPNRQTRTSKNEAGNSLSDRGSCSKRVRVLVLYTNRANAVSNPSSVASAGINLFNSAKRSSLVSDSDVIMELVGVRALSAFVETDDIRDDLDRAVTFGDIRVLRDQYRADLAVVLTDGNYGGVLGIAALFDYGNRDRGHVALVEANGGSWTFPHETGHLMGCQHDVVQTQAPNVPTSAKGHNWFYRKRFLGIVSHRWQKSIVAGGNAEGYYVSAFSNPAIKFETRSVGYSGTSDRNNSLQLKNSACTVSNYIVSEPDPILGVTISGPYSAYTGESFSLTASVTNCPSRTYRWEKSLDGYYYNFAGSGSSLSITPYTTDNIYVRLTVICSNGQSKTAYRTISVSSGKGGGTYPEMKSTGSPEVEEKGGVEYNKAIVNYPNPASDVLSLSSGFEASKNVKVYLSDILNGGKNRKVYQGPLDSFNPLDLDIANFNQGLYRLEVYENGKLIFKTKQLIVR